MMEKQEIKYQIELLENELNALFFQKEKSTNDEEINAIVIKESEINRMIFKLKWHLKNSNEKQEHRRMMVNVSKKWGSMQWNDLPVEDKITLEYYVDMYDLAQELLQKKDIPERIVSVLKELIEQIDLEF